MAGTIEFVLTERYGKDTLIYATLIDGTLFATCFGMEHPFYEIIEQYGIYAVFFLCTVEGDITLLISGVMAHGGFFGNWSFLKVIFFGTLGGMVGDSFGYMVGRIFHENAKDYRFYQVAQPRVEKLIEKFGGSAIVISKYIYGIRVAMCVFYGVGRMPFLRFIGLSALSCGLWVTILSGVGYFFSGAITSILGDYQRIGIALFFILMFVVVVFFTSSSATGCRKRSRTQIPKRSRRSRKNCWPSKTLARSRCTTSASGCI